MNVVELLLRMKLTIRKRGWVQRSYENSEGVCLVGAYNVVAGEHNMVYEDAVARLARHHLYAVTGTSNLENWNDNINRTQAQVEDVIDAAINRARENAADAR